MSRDELIEHVVASLRVIFDEQDDENLEIVATVSVDTVLACQGRVSQSD